MSINLTKRIFTGLFLICLLILAFLYKYILIFTLIIISVSALIEINIMISKMIIKNNLLILLFRASSLLYICLFSLLIYEGISQSEPNYKLNMIYLFSVCISSDIGGFTIGKTFKGKKLTEISPNKTISGSLGSFIFSLILVPIFYQLFSENFQNIYDLIILSVIVSLFSQLGDLFISYLKRKAKIKDTGNILPGHGGILDRIDGILLGVPIGIILWEFLLVV
tara:strand:+ start:225 stop:893 length:669 start_codon:yes stop_codon:yes gene_type:complete